MGCRDKPGNDMQGCFTSKEKYSSKIPAFDKEAIEAGEESHREDGDEPTDKLLNNRDYKCACPTAARAEQSCQASQQCSKQQSGNDDDDARNA